jgi:hypothetical protein
MTPTKSIALAAKEGGLYVELTLKSVRIAAFR